MTELKPCPFCGGDDLEIDHAPTYDVHHPDVYEVHCTECGGRGGEGWDEAEAIEAWNTRAERTCSIEHAKGGALYDVWRCSACGYEYAESVADESIVQNYCPNCGRKVNQ